MKERLVLTAVIVAILVGPVAMLCLAYCTNHTGPAKSAPKPIVSVRSV
jgi:hypothetical protein